MGMQNLNANIKKIYELYYTSAPAKMLPDFRAKRLNGRLEVEAIV
jgi:CRISPR/Cas system endoribonuclease Cas6 (RAMP superfamily)